MVSSNTDSGRPRQLNASTDPVVVGLGRLLVGVGVVALLGVLAVLLLILSGFGGI